MSTATKPKTSNSAAEPETSNKKIKLMGPAKIEFDTFMDQCIYFADLYWPDWNNYNSPSSYVIPPVFTFKHLGVSDEDAQKLVQQHEEKRHQTQEEFRRAREKHQWAHGELCRAQKLRRAQEEVRQAQEELCRAQEELRRAQSSANTMRDHVLTDRVSDEAEHIVYCAMQQLVEDKVQAPIFVVHNLNIHNNVKLISLLFPYLDEEPFSKTFEQCKKEFDFLIVGPRVGIIAIEVKSSQYTASKHFMNNRLPDEYIKGLQQLESVDALFCSLATCAKLVPPNALPSIRKILFTQNLTRKRYDTWKSSIGDVARRTVESRTNDVIQWFTEDMDNYTAHSTMPPLYSKLRYILEGSKTSLTRAISEKYALLISGLRSMIHFGGDFQLKTQHFSQNEAMLSEHQRIVEQNLFDGGKTLKLSKHSPLKPIDRTKLNYEPQVFILSPDQQAVLEGPSRQFIIGAAGTGKTVILQAKALQLLSEGEEVVVFSPKCYMEQYEKLFDSYGFKNYQCMEWPYEGFKHVYRHFKTSENFVKPKSNFQKRDTAKPEPQMYSYEELVSRVREYINEESTSKTLDWLFNKNIMIDDTCDPSSAPRIGTVSPFHSLLVALLLMEYIVTVCPKKTAWTVLDPAISRFEWTKFSPLEKNMYRRILEGLVSAGLEQGGAERFRMSLLRQVMRCSGSVFCSAYAAEGSRKLPWVSGTEPILAHKIQGLQTDSTRDVFGSMTREDAVSRLFDKVQKTLGRLSREGVDMANVGLIYGNTIYPSECHRFLANGSIPFYAYYEVSSMEWPVVIYATCFHSAGPRITGTVVQDDEQQELALKHVPNASYARYRAMTRATTRLIDISVVYAEIFKK